jgi:hypothetical protein
MLLPDRSQMTIWRMRITFWIPNTTDTHSGHVTLIPFLLQQWLQETASILRHAYIVYLVHCREGVHIVAVLYIKIIFVI